MDFLAPVRSFDQLQRRHKALAVPLAVLKKVSDDGAGNFAALIAYYAFLSMFPLLLLAVAILGFIVHSDASVRSAIENSGLPHIPPFNSLANGHLRGSGVGIIIGALGALWAGLGVTMVLQNVFNQINGVPYNRRPNFIKVRLRGVRLLLTVGVLEIVATSIAGVLSAGHHGALLTVAGILVAFGFNVLLFFFSFRQLTTETVATSKLWPGIIFASIGWELLQSLGGLYVAHVLHGADATYGSFAAVIGLIAWLYLGARVVVYGAELNSVVDHHYWPRSLLDPPAPADDDVHRTLAEVQERGAQENVSVTFTPPAARPSPATNDSPPPPLNDGAESGARERRTDGVDRLSAGGAFQHLRRRVRLRR
jgi:membrane protein